MKSKAVTGGRPKSFDYQELLAQAVKVFWQKGFKNTSVRDLAMSAGLTTGTLYNEFGNKEDLFCACLHHYIETVIKPRVDLILLSDDTSFIPSQKEDSPALRIQYFLTSSIDIPQATHIPKSCFLVNTVIELGQNPENDRIKAELHQGLNYINSGLKKQLGLAQRQGYLPQNQEMTPLLVQVRIFMTGLLLSASDIDTALLKISIHQFVDQLLHRQTHRKTPIHTKHPSDNDPRKASEK